MRGQTINRAASQPKERIRKAYVDVPLEGGTIQTHHRTAGHGAPLVLLHPSPLHSQFLTPQMRALEDLCQVFAPDTPGYGQSDPLPEPGTDLSPYVAWLDAYREAIGVKRLSIYGSATGAQIAIAYGRSHPDRVNHLLLDNAVYFQEAEWQGLISRYFPDIAPQRDGSHLQVVWDMVTGLYRGFPWYEKPSSPMPEVPTEILHATALAYLAAGTDYDRAYRAAFKNERLEQVQALTVPTTIMRWQGSLLKTYADRFDQHAWPAHIRMKFCDAAPEARLGAIREVVMGLEG